ncbi:unnamed protein product [Clavelina lepadiformis]|uniref:Regulator of G-protein signaling 3 n=2 Tax=Clavelina lepadiformis TaxID=159417 RepID=A0ABP0F9P6_CLALP
MIETKPLVDVTNQNDKENVFAQKSNRKSFIRNRRIKSRRPLPRSLRVKTLNKIFAQEKTETKPTDTELLAAARNAAWKRYMNGSSTSSYTSEDDEVLDRKMMYSPTYDRWDSSDISSDSEEDSDDMYSSNARCGRTLRYMREATSASKKSGFQSRKFRKVRSVVLSPDDKYVNSDIRRSSNKKEIFPRVGASTPYDCAGVIAEKSQLQLVICASVRKLTITILGLKSLPQPATADEYFPRQVYVRLSLSPDNEDKIRYKTTPCLVVGDSANLHETFTFEISRRNVNRRLLISTWSSGEGKERPAFIGCMSFGLRTILNSQEVVQGWYYLLREALGRKKHLKVKAAHNEHLRRCHVSPARTPSCVHSHVYEDDKNLSQRRSSNRSENSDSSLTSKDCHQGKYQCKKCCSEEDQNSYDQHRDERRLSKLRKRRRVTFGIYQENNPENMRPVGVSLSSTSDEIQKENLQVDVVISHPVFQHRMGQALEKKSSEVNGVTIRKPGSKTPTGRRHLRRKTYSASELLLSRLSYCTNNDDDVFIDDEVALKKFHFTNRDKDSKKDLLEKQKFSECSSKKNLSVEFSPSRSDHQISSLVSVSSDSKDSSCTSAKEESHLFEQSRVVSPEDNESPTNTGASHEKNTSAHSAFGDESIHIAKDYGMTSSSKDYSRSFYGNTSKPREDGSQTIEQLLQHADDICENTGKVNAFCNTENIPEKSKLAPICSIKTWLQRKTQDGDIKPLQRSKSLYRPKSKSCENENTTKLRRSSSIYRPKKRNAPLNYGKCNTLLDLLQSKGGISAFRAFLCKEYSEENLDFWLDCEAFKQLKGSKQRKMAIKIYGRYFETNSPNEINIDAAARNKTESHLENPTTDMFDEAQGKIFLLMETDSFKRFLKKEKNNSSSNTINAPAPTKCV